LKHSGFIRRATGIAWLQFERNSAIYIFCRIELYKVFVKAFVSLFEKITLATSFALCIYIKPSLKRFFSNGDLYVTYLNILTLFSNSMNPVPLDVKASYIVIIDDILAKSDLNTISSKRIREGLQQAVDYDITPQKVQSRSKSSIIYLINFQNAIKTLIMERFDKFAADAKDIPATNGHSTGADPEPEPSPKEEPESRVKTDSQDSKSGVKRKSESQDGDDSEELSDAPSTPPKKKRRSVIDDDAAFAARLQAEENSRARPTRGGNVRKPPVVKKKKPKAPKKKTSTKVGADDDSELDDSETGAERKVNRSGAFHVCIFWIVTRNAKIYRNLLHYPLPYPLFLMVLPRYALILFPHVIPFRDDSNSISAITSTNCKTYMGIR
jgi:upstream activation factor subunit UAF30